MTDLESLASRYIHLAQEQLQEQTNQLRIARKQHGDHPQFIAYFQIQAEEEVEKWKRIVRRLSPS